MDFVVPLQTLPAFRGFVHCTFQSSIICRRMSALQMLCHARREGRVCAGDIGFLLQRKIIPKCGEIGAVGFHLFAHKLGVANCQLRHHKNHTSDAAQHALHPSNSPDPKHDLWHLLACCSTLPQKKTPQNTQCSVATHCQTKVVCTSGYGCACKARHFGIFCLAPIVWYSPAHTGQQCPKPPTTCTIVECR